MKAATFTVYSDQRWEQGRLLERNASRFREINVQEVNRYTVSYFDNRLGRETRRKGDGDSRSWGRYAGVGEVSRNHKGGSYANATSSLVKHTNTPNKGKQNQVQKSRKLDTKNWPGSRLSTPERYTGSTPQGIDQPSATGLAPTLGRRIQGLSDGRHHIKCGDIWA